MIDFQFQSTSNFWLSFDYSSGIEKEEIKNLASNHQENGL